VRAVEGTELSVRFALGGTRSEGPYVALVLPAGPGLSSYDRLMFTARTSQPMRVSVQMRVPGGDQGERWHRSIYLDENPRDVSIFFDDMTPRGPTSRRRPVLESVREFLFVIDSQNTSLGASGRMWLDNVKYGR
jgi:hypothetical protein